MRRLALVLAVVLVAPPALADELGQVDAAGGGLSVAWSKTVAGSAWRMGSPVVADVDGDGTNDIVIADTTGHVRVYNADGSLQWQRPVIVPGSATPTAVESTVTVADLDGDSSPELIVGAISNEIPHQQGGLVTFDARGNVKWRWHTRDIFNMWNPSVGATPDGFNEGVISTPAIGDVDGDGQPDVVFGAFDNSVWALRGDGTPINGFPYWVDDSIWSSIALYDGDGDGRSEIYVGVAGSPGGPVDHAGGVLMALDWDGGRVAPLWIQYTGETINSSPAVGDIDGDGYVDIVVGTGLDYGTADSNKVFAWRADNGRPLSGWPRSTGGATHSSPSLGDVDGDGRIDVVIGSRDGRVWAWRGDGTPLWNATPYQPGEGGGEIIASPTLADLDGNGSQDIVIGNGWSTFFLRGNDGARLYAPAKYGYTYQNAAAVGYFGAAGWRVILAGFTDAQSHLTALSIPTPGSVPAWPQWRHGPRHDGNSAAVASCPSPVAGAAVPPDSDTRFTPLAPARVLDTRRGLGSGRVGALAGGCTLALQVTGSGGVPANDVAAVTMNVTVTRPVADGYLTVYPCGRPLPNASNVNYTAGQTVPNLVTVAVGASGKVCLFAHRTVHVVADVAGWYGDTGGRFHPLTPTRVIDTREHAKVAGGATLRVPITGAAGVPASDVSAVALNVTATEPVADGYLTVYPCGQPVPEASNVNYLAGHSVPNMVVVPVGAGGAVCVYAMTSTHVIADVAGWYGMPGTTGGATFTPLTPQRVLDTRTGHGASGKVAPQQPLRLRVAENGGVPSSGVVAVTLNVTATETDGGGYLTVYPCGSQVPVASNLNYRPGQTVPNLVTVAMSPQGEVCVASYRPAHVLVDVAGWFGTPA